MKPSYDSSSDAELIALLRDEDHNAFTEIYRRFWDKIFVLAFNRLKDQAEAEEIVQEVFLSLWKRRETLQVQYSLNTYLSTAVKYQIINRQSRNYLKTQSDLSLASLPEQGIDSTQLWFSERELKRQLDYHVEQLPEKCRLVFKLSRELYLSNAEIAQQMGVTEKAVEAHITRALKVLKGKLHFGIPLISYLLSK
ncbi:RNA polymerase sigma-70 factor [Pedobacter vanadiisoli]|uniref:RNA polymerase sigma-70 factor n=1 Tax=Pedobacter vanadiisoli TaxID=1761975 RepID=A0ABW5MGQ5_9SPHI